MIKTETIIVGVLSVIALCGVIILTILSYDTQVLTTILGSLIGFFVGTKREVIGSYLGGKKLGHKK